MHGAIDAYCHEDVDLISSQQRSLQMLMQTSLLEPRPVPKTRQDTSGRNRASFLSSLYHATRADSTSRRLSPHSCTQVYKPASLPIPRPTAPNVQARNTRQPCIQCLEVIRPVPFIPEVQQVAEHGLNRLWNHPYACERLCAVYSQVFRVRKNISLLPMALLQAPAWLDLVGDQ